MKPPTRQKAAETIRVEEIAMDAFRRMPQWLSTGSVLSMAGLDFENAHHRVGIILGRMVREGRIRRVRPGVFALPKTNQPY